MTAYIILTLLLIGTLFLCYTLYQKLNYTKKKLSLLERVTDRKERRNQKYTSLLSKEIRTPLYGIMGLVNILTEEHPILENDKNIKTIKFSSDYLLSLMNNVQQVNNLDSRDVFIDDKLFDLKELSQNIVNSFSYATENSDNSLILNFDDTSPKTLKGKPAIISQIIINLISNALRFTTNGNIVFFVDVIQKKGIINTISFKVVHDGNDISREDEKSIYNEFINIEHIKQSYLGTSLSSAIVRQLATSIGGNIQLQNNSKSGSEYIFTIDLESINHQESISNDTIKNHKPTALIVDDNKLNLLVADKILSKENFSCTTVNNGFDAIKLTKDSTYDIILMDINMPKLNGIGATKRIREFNNTTPIIALTGVDITQLNSQIVRAGFNDYILKPYDKNVLLEMIKKHLNN